MDIVSKVRRPQGPLSRLFPFGYVLLLTYMLTLLLLTYNTCIQLYNFWNALKMTWLVETSNIMIECILVLLFLIKLKIKSKLTGFEYFKKRYGEEGFCLYKNVLNRSLKLNKLNLDLDFLLKCKTYNVFPKFLRFRWYKKSLE